MTISINGIERSIDIVGPYADPKVKAAILDNLPLLIEAGINSPARIKMFLAQMAHESMGFSRLEEVRSDTSSERKYGHTTRVGKILGNTEEGDGAKFKGRGIIQLTGRYNYDKYGKKLGLDFIRKPELAAKPHIAVKVAVKYWQDKNLNEWADAGDVKTVTKRINGGYNGLADRTKRYESLRGVKI